ncbi:MAG: zinc ribbon domain-containing protein [Deltaproteobacteria bacterium]|nr:MAG: zinc ribbon domain-containing protein [Deltaproteobacteria bacterium]
MPIYEYECPDCGAFEHIQPISSKPLRKCPSCGRRVRKLVSSSSFRLKGGGWYADGYSSRKPSGNGSNGDKSASATGGESASKETSTGGNAGETAGGD